MKKFSLEEYLKNPDREVVTRDGRKVRIICTDRKNHDNYPIIALVETDEDDERVRSFKIDGKWSIGGMENDLDLFFAPEKHEGWVNIYKNTNTGSMYCDCNIYASKEAATKQHGVTIAKIEWEE